MTKQYIPLTPEDWIAKGYKQFKSTIKPLADFGLQKRFIRNAWVMVMKVLSIVTQMVNINQDVLH